MHTNTRLRSLFILVSFTPLLISGASSQVNVTTYHNDNARTGQNIAETTLTLQNVNADVFGKNFTVSVDGQVYAQPLVLSNVTIGGTKHNVVYVATENDSVYALDSATGAMYWRKSFLGSGVTPVSVSDLNNGQCTNIKPIVGITSTPAIDSSSGTIYVVAKTKENGVFYQRLHALDVSTAAEKFGGPVVITAPGFDALHHLNRPGLLLENGHVIIAFGSHCDWTPYQGRVMSYSASTLKQEAVFNATPNGSQGAVWMSGGGVAADSSGNLYFATGNGTFDDDAITPVDFGDSVVKLSPPSGGKFTVADWFTPWNESSLNSGDVDVGSGGVLVLPDLPPGPAHRYLLVQMGKDGAIDLLDRTNMGKHCENCSSDTNIVETLVEATEGVWGSPAYWNGFLYWGAAWDGGAGDNLMAFPFNVGNTGLISTSPLRSSEVFSFPGPTPSVSANGTTNGIVWALDTSSNNSSCCAVLHAYQATNMSELYNSNTNAARDQLGGAVKFTVPTIANGRVYVGGNGFLSAFGSVPGVRCSVSESCTQGVGIATGSISLSCSAPSQISVSAQVCALGCNSSNNSGFASSISTTAQAQDLSSVFPSCTFGYCYNGICH